MNETNQAPATGGTKLSTIFMIVLGLHVVVIVVISAFYFMKGRSHPEMADTSTAPITEGAPAITSDTAQAPGTSAAEPTLETNTAPIISSEMIDTMANSEPASPMPQSNDPIWSNPTADNTEPATTQNTLVTSNELKTPPARLDMEPKTVAPAKKAPIVAASKAKTYQVASGDNLTKIAKKTGTTVAKLKQTNGLTADSLKVGQVLKVPGSVAVAPATTAVATNAPEKAPVKKSAPIVAASATTPSAQTSYQVVPGDNLTKIAKKNNTTVAKLKQANGLTADSLKIGQVLKVPGTAAAKTSAKTPPVREAEASSTIKKPFREPTITMDMARL